MTSVLLTSMMNVIEFLRAKRDVEGLKELMSTLLEPETRPNTLDYYLGANCAKYIQVKTTTHFLLSMWWTTPSPVQMPVLFRKYAIYLKRMTCCPLPVSKTPSQCFRRVKKRDLPRCSSMQINLIILSCSAQCSIKINLVSSESSYHFVQRCLLEK